MMSELTFFSEDYLILIHSHEAISYETRKTGLRDKVINRRQFTSIVNAVSDITSIIKRFNLTKPYVVFAIEDTKDQNN